MKTSWVTRIRQGLLLAALVGAGAGMAGCADEYGAYPGYRGGYYASYSAPYPYYGGYGYGYGYPYRTYGPYYGGGYYGYGAPNYRSSAVVVSGNRTYTYRDRFGRVHTARNVNRERTQTVRRTTRTRSARVPSYQNDDENRYYQRP